MNIDHNYYDTTYFIEKRKKKNLQWTNVLYVIACNEQFFSYIKAMKQKEIKAPIIYITVHIPTSIQRNRNLKQKEVT